MSAVEDPIAPPDTTATDEQPLQDTADNAPELPDTPPQENSSPTTPPAPRRLVIYSAKQLLALYKSPLVCAPPNMPDLKDWFGSENETSLNKKDFESTPPNTARERRFRRDADDGETPTRPSYRSALSNTSQMGNFKHQSIRDRDGDNRDREGLRSLSDKFDRGDRLPLSLNSLRGKDRDALGSTRATTSGALANGPTRRTDARENGKKKDSTDFSDWRRGEPRRNDREDRDRNGRDTSRTRRDSSPPPRRGDRDRDEKDEGRHWRDDGRRDERVAARRGEREKGDRWTADSERDSHTRTKRTTGRDKKSDDPKEREKEKEPAWMDTYIPPSTSSTGILGGKDETDGELDGIQAFKKNMKEKEQRAAAIEASEPPPSKPSGEKGLDEIQLFKMLMKQARDEPETNGAVAPGSDAPAEKGLTSLFSGLGERAKARNEGTPSSPAPPGLDKAPWTEPTSTTSTSSYQPPAGSRLLALGRGTKATTPTPEIIPTQSTPPPQSALSQRMPSLLDMERQSQAHPGMDKGFSPFEEQMHTADPRKDNWNDPNDNKGSRFAKFFDGRPREQQQASTFAPTPKQQPAMVHHTPSRQDALYDSNPPERTMDDLVAMLNTSAHIQRGNPQLAALNGQNAGNLREIHAQNQLHLLQQQQQQQQQLQYAQQQRNHQLESLYENRMDNRNFVPDNMVPGLRSAPPPRTREGYPDPLDEALHINAQRLPQMHRGLDPLYASNMGQYAQQGRVPGIPPVQQQYRGGPSPGAGQNGLNRLPPGLANLGNRPPHDPAQFPGGLAALNNAAALHSNGLSAQQYSNYGNVSVGGYGNIPRNVPPQTLMAQQHLAAQMELRAQAQQAGMHRAGLGGYPTQQQQMHPAMRQAQPPHIALMQQQQQHIPQHPQSQQSADLMALLLGGRRE
ncbi:hypothetical protein CYLTODRAFT_417522 [Cylindrobasidium torrendii FP15055 ss-10]|uniref:Uncharacterized protein n=1 Tax=Cylindrobasidium torrendii FP15055 ss-10 TaxID=1314674 RepID=A0A0D7BR96_9AGAR|nr:hypothetical protein CYLTODRAFT_417522 [Cylindrobasidium torrendii FP15055 ss-10]